MIRPLSRITTALPARPSYRAALESTPRTTTKKKTIHYTYLSTLTRTTIESVTPSSSSRRLVREETKGREIALGSIIIIIINAMLCPAATDAYSRRTAEEYKLHSSGAEEEEKT